MSSCERLDFRGHPRVVAVGEHQLRQFVFGMGIKTGRHQYELWLEPFDRGQPDVGDDPSKLLTSGSCREGGVDDVVGGWLGADVGIVRMLEGGAEQYPVVVFEYILGAIAVVNIEIENGDARQAVDCHRLGGSHGDVIEKTESHRIIARRVVSGRPDTTEHCFFLSGKNQIDPLRAGTRSALCGLKGIGVHYGIRVDLKIAPRRRSRPEERFDVVRSMNPLQLFAGNPRRLVAPEQRFDARLADLMLNGAEPGRRLGVSTAHFVLSARCVR